MEFLSSLYPPLSARPPLPQLFAPLLYSLSIIAALLPRNPTLRFFLLSPLFLALTLLRPYYTAGSPVDDYNNATVYFFLPLSFLDLYVLSPLEGRGPRWQGRSKILSRDGSQTHGKKNDESNSSSSSSHIGKSTAADLPSFSEEEFCGASPWARAKWALHLLASARGIGWDWQVKNVHAHRAGEGDGSMGKWEVVRRHAGRAAWFWGLRCLSVYGMGFTTATATTTATTTIYGGGLQRGEDLGWGWRVLRAWICGCWGYQGLAQMYYLGAAVTIALGCCEAWEWPPIFGRLGEAWSVRQMWSVVWHQNLRRAVQQPGIRLSRLLGLPKGTLASKYFQLYVAFAISMLSHQWHNFNAVRADVGEFRFFMSQAVAITIEDFVQWCWKRATGRIDKDPLTSFERTVGWIWTFAWFSYSLPAWSTGMLGAEVIGHDPDTMWALQMGRQHGTQFFVRN